MSKYDNPTQSADCPSCGSQALHRVVFEGKLVRHLRCDACDAPHVCPMKGSFQATLQPLAFADLIADAKEGKAEAYSIRRAFHPTNTFAHPKFGTGYVFAILSPPQKMEVIFEDKARFLVCGPGSGVLEPSDEEAPEEITEGKGAEQEASIVSGSAATAIEDDEKPIF